MKKYKIMIGRPVGLGFEHPDIGTYLFELAGKIGCHPQISEAAVVVFRSSRILMNRNNLAKIARDAKADFLLMVDPDMQPDCYSRGNLRQPGNRFFETAFALAISKRPMVIGAPASCDPPLQAINVWRGREDGNMIQVSHAEALLAKRSPCMEEVAAMGSGLMLIDTLAFDVMEHPYFDDVYWNETKTALKYTQDIYFTMNASNAGVSVYCNWYAWAGHHKDVMLACPGEEPLPASEISEEPEAVSAVGLVIKPLSLLPMPPPTPSPPEAASDGQRHSPLQQLQFPHHSHDRTERHGLLSGGHSSVVHRHDADPASLHRDSREVPRGGRRKHDGSRSERHAAANVERPWWDSNGQRDGGNREVGGTPIGADDGQHTASHQPIHGDGGTEPGVQLQGMKAASRWRFDTQIIAPPTPVETDKDNVTTN